MAYPYNLETKTFTGTFADLYQDPATGEVKSRHREGIVWVTPYYDKIRVLDQDVVIDLYELQRQQVKMVDGSFSVELLVTNQSNISPGPDGSGNGWTYKFEMSWMKGYEANIPINSDLAESNSIHDWFVNPERPGLIVTKGDAGTDGTDGTDGRGVVSLTANGNIATVEYTDGSSSIIALPGGGGAGSRPYEHNQTTAAAEWAINHNQGKYITACFVTYDLNNTYGTNDQVFATWTNVDENNIIVHHGNASSGKAILN